MNYPISLIHDNWKILAHLHIVGGELESSLMSISFRAFIYLFIYCRFYSGSAAVPQVEGADVAGI